MEGKRHFKEKIGKLAHPDLGQIVAGSHMKLFISKIMGSVLQIILFMSIPFIWWLATARKKQKFAELKRLENKLGFNIANVIQALLFGLMHGVMFFSLVGVIKAILILAFTCGIAWLICSRVYGKISCVLYFFIDCSLYAHCDHMRFFHFYFT